MDPSLNEGGGNAINPDNVFADVFKVTVVSTDEYGNNKVQSMETEQTELAVYNVNSVTGESLNWIVGDGSSPAVPIYNAIDLSSHSSTYDIDLTSMFDSITSWVNSEATGSYDISEILSDYNSGNDPIHSILDELFSSGSTQSTITLEGVGMDFASGFGINTISTQSTGAEFSSSNLTINSDNPQAFSMDNSVLRELYLEYLDGNTVSIQVAGNLGEDLDGDGSPDGNLILKSRLIQQHQAIAPMLMLNLSLVLLITLLKCR